jgi:hypothetical protein
MNQIEIVKYPIKNKGFQTAQNTSKQTKTQRHIHIHARNTIYKRTNFQETSKIQIQY